MESTIEVRRVDEQGRLVIPSDWRKRELGGSGEVIIVKGRGFLKIIPKRKPNLRKYFDSVDLGVDIIEDWEEFERKFHEIHRL